MFKSLSIAQLKWKAVYTLCGCFFLSATLAIDYSLQHWIWEFSFWGSGRCSPPNWSTKSIESTLIGSQSFIPRGHLRIVSYNFRQNNVVIYSKRTCLPGQFHSAHDTVCKDFPAQEIGAKTAPLLMATHVLLRYREPVPHVLVQSLHELHRDHLDSEINVVLDC